MNNKCGFTLTELVIVILIIAILSVVAVPVYRGYVKRGIATEGKALLGEINAAQQSYYYRHGYYYAGTAGQQYNASFGVDARTNQYFTSYTITAGDNTFQAVTNDYKGKQGQSLTLVGSFTAVPEIIDNFSNTN